MQGICGAYMFRLSSLRQEARVAAITVNDWANPQRV